jgi:hypothetical protein
MGYYPHEAAKSKTHEVVKGKTHEAVKGKTHESVKGKTHEAVKGKTHEEVKGGSYRNASCILNWISTCLIAPQQLSSIQKIQVVSSCSGISY